MVQIIQENRKPRFSDQLKRGILGGGQAIGKGIADLIGAHDLEKKYGVPAHLTLQVGPEKSHELYQNLLATKQFHDRFSPSSYSQEEQEQSFLQALPELEQLLGTQFPEDRENLTPASEEEFQRRQVHGISPQELDSLWEQTKQPEGRGGQQASLYQDRSNQEIPPIGPFKELSKQQFKERESIQKEYRTRNLNRIDEELPKKRNLQVEASDIAKLKTLNRSGKMSSGLRSRLAVKDNQIVIPGQLSPESEVFLKTVNRWANRAKDSFGSRVTNFDLQSFMAQLPGLLNSPEGRELIIKDMEILNHMNRVYNDAVTQLGSQLDVGQVSPAKFDDLVERSVQGKIDPLLREYEGIQDRIDKISPTEQRVSSLDKANTQNLPAGSRAVNQKTGETMEWDGKKWLKIQ